jgi:hypothetical protein
MRKHLRHVLLAALIFSAARTPARADTELVDFPFVLEAGRVVEPVASGAREHWVPDVRFDPARGYGFTGGRPGRCTLGAALGGDASWPLLWRDGVEKYIFRVPRGQYVVELSFIETDVAAPGLRVFDVLAEGKPLFSTVDIFEKVGDFAWLTLRGRVAVYDGWIDLNFVSHTPDWPPRVSRVTVALRGQPSSSSALPPGRDVRKQGSSPAQSLEPMSLADGQQLGLHVYELRISEHELRRMSVRLAPAVEVPGELHSLGDVDSVFISYDVDTTRWHRKKSFRIRVRDESNRSIRGQKSLYLSAEFGDPTLLRAMASAAVAESAGLTTPSVEPVAVLLNGRFQGLYFDTELLGKAFRKRWRLDRVGLLALETGGDHLTNSWEPRGQKRGKGGNLVSLTVLTHQLNRLDEGRVLQFFEDRFYLDRYIDRLAVRVLCGGDSASEPRFFLKDSRNGKWETLQQTYPSGSLGVHDFETHPRSLSAGGESAVRRMLLGRSLEAGSGRGVSVLETRFMSQSVLRHRLFNRVESLLADELAPEKIDVKIDNAFARIRSAALRDPYLRLTADRLSHFRAGPRRLKAEYRARAELLRQGIARERTRPDSPLLLNEVLVRGASGAPWVEVVNASGAPVDPSPYFLACQMDAEAFRLPLPARKPLASGELLHIPLPPTTTLASPSGGFLSLYRQRSPDRQLPGDGHAPRGHGDAAICDFLFVGHQSPGKSYGRLAAGPRHCEWGFLREPTPGAANVSTVLAPPPYGYRHGLVRGSEGDFTIWFKTASVGVRKKLRPEKVVLMSKAEGLASYQSADMAWDPSQFRYSFRFEAQPSPSRTAYYFLATSPDGIEAVYPLPAPHLTFFLPVLPGLKLNEVLPRPVRTSEGPEGPEGPGEFVEIYNAGEHAVDLGGRFLSDSSRNPSKWRIPAGYRISPKGFAVLYVDGAGRGNHASFKLSNSGEFLGLYTRMEEGNLLIDSLRYRAMRVGEAWGATPDGSGNFRVRKHPTPGAPNVPPVLEKP